MSRTEAYIIDTLENYPDNGKHQQCWIELPFEIKKGEDGYYWMDKNKVEHPYNMFKENIDDRWIVHLAPDANQSLLEIFEIKVNKDLNKILQYCFKVYRKSLKMELDRLNHIEKSLSHE